MSWHYSQAPAVESSAESYAVTLASELLRLRNTPGKFSSNGNEMESCHSSRSGMTSAPSAATTQNVQNTLNCSEALPASLSSRADSHARIFPPLEKAQALREVGQGCGVKWLELSAKYDPDSHSWKTHRCLFPEVLQPSSVTLPNWGMMLDGVCWELMMPAHRTDGNESGLWPTPTSSIGGIEPAGETGRKLVTAVAHGGSTTRQIWPTPRAYESTESMETICARREKTGQGHLNMTAVVNTMEKKKGQLNPNWVEWLMGWPIGWTDLKPLGTDRFRQWLGSHGVPLPEQEA